MGYFEPCQKQKLLILQKILLEKTDENHPMTINEIIYELGKFEIKVERKTAYSDIDTLVSFGMDIAIAKLGRSNAYFVESRVFQDEELQILADAVASSKFLTTKKSNELIKKLQTFTSKFKAQQLKRSIYVENRAKTVNESVYYNINAIHDAIAIKHKITFKYFEYNVQKKKQFRHNGEVYCVSPYQLIWSDDNYYLICFCDKHETLSRYRVDRMSEVDISSEKARVLSPEEADFAKNLRSTYGMYAGEIETVTLELDNGLMSLLIDRYGEAVNTRPETATTFIARIEVQISPPFWGWLFQLGKDARIVAPQNVALQAEKWLENIAKLYPQEKV